LDLSHNELSDLPKEIGLLRELRNFNLNVNRLTNLPDELCRLTNLQSLKLEHNRFKKIPLVLKKMKFCEIFLLDNPLIDLYEFLEFEPKSYPSQIEIYQNYQLSTMLDYATPNMLTIYYGKDIENPIKCIISLNNKKYVIKFTRANIINLLSYARHQSIVTTHQNKSVDARFVNSNVIITANDISNLISNLHMLLIDAKF
jgi:Leucine-rich repeat (LRR) protein